MSTGTRLPPPPPVQHEPEEPDTAATGGGGQAVGVVLVALGALWLLARLGVPLEAGWVLPIVVIGLGILVLTGVGGAARGTFITLGIILAVVALVSTSVSTVPSDAVGERAQVISTLEGVASEDLGIGSLQLDLRGLEADATGSLEASVGIGELVVVLPPDLPVAVSASSGIGEVRVLDQSRGGFGSSLEVTDPTTADAEVELDLSVGIGSVRVQR
jgi:hypothetical protein